MYVPAHFKQDDPVELRRLMREHNFATLVTVGPDGAPFASHLPMLVEDEDRTARFSCARTWPAPTRSGGTSTTARRRSPSSTVRTRSCIRTGTTPRRTCRRGTYAVVHAYGPVRLTDDAVTTRGIAYRLVAQHTPDMRPIPEEYERKLLAAVVTFELRVNGLEGKYKLSQNKSD